jgi:hypothetical protein
MEVVACSLSESSKSTEHGVVVEAGMSCTGGGVGEPETLRDMQHVGRSASFRRGRCWPGNTRQFARRTHAAFCGRTPALQNGLRAGLAGMIAIIAAVAPGRSAVGTT